MTRQQLTEALAATANEDPIAFARLYNATSAKLLSICRQSCSSREAAEDVLQEVYAAIWRYADRFDPARSSPITWMIVIARNKAFDRHRREARQPSGSNAPLDLLLDPSATASEAMLLDEIDRDFHQIIDGLAAEQRDAIKSAFFENLTYLDRTARTGISISTLKSRVRRGLARLRERLTATAE